MKLNDLNKRTLIERKVKEEEVNDNPLHEVGLTHGKVAQHIEEIMGQVSPKLAKVEGKAVEDLSNKVDKAGDKVGMMIKKLPKQKDPAKFAEKINNMTQSVLADAVKAGEIQKRAKTRGPDKYRECVARISGADSIQEIYQFIEKNGIKNVSKQVYDYYVNEVNNGPEE